MKQHPPQVVLLQYFDLQLNEVQKEILDGHLLVCRHCAQIIEDLKKMKQAHQSSPMQFQLNPQLKSRILNQAQTALQTNRRMTTKKEKSNKPTSAYPLINFIERIPQTGLSIAAGVALLFVIMRPPFSYRTEHSIFSEDNQRDYMAKEYFFQGDTPLPNREIIFPLGDENE